VRAQLGPLGPDEELIDARSFERIYAGLGTEGAWARLEDAPCLPDAAPAEVEIPATPEAHGHRAVDLAHRFASAAAFFLVSAGGLQPVCGDGLVRARTGLLFSTERWSPFASAIESAKAIRGAPGQDALTQRVLRLLGRRGVREIALVPIVLRGRTLALLVADNGPERLPDFSFAGLCQIGARLAQEWPSLPDAGGRRRPSGGLL
jgi:hypothetical protein